MRLDGGGDGVLTEMQVREDFTGHVACFNSCASCPSVQVCDHLFIISWILF